MDSLEITILIFIAFWAIIILMGGIVAKNEALIQVGDERRLNARALEQILVTITASGFLGVSISLVADLRGTINLIHKWLLDGSWLLFTASIVLIIISYIFSDWESAVRTKKLEGKPDTFSSEEWDALVLRNWRCIAIDICNWSSTAFVVIGIIMIAIFAMVNFG